MPGDVLHLRDDVLSADVPSMLAFNQSIAILGPDTPTVPSIAINVPTAVGVCDSLKLDASATSGSGGRRMAFNYTLVECASGGCANVTASLNEANAANGGYGSHTATIPSSAMPKDTKMVFRLTVRNFLGEVAAKSDGHQARLPGAHRLHPGRQPARDHLRRRACAPRRRGAPGDVVRRGLAFGRQDEKKSSVATTNPRILRIAPEQLKATESYEFQCFVALTSNPNNNSTASVTVEVLQQPITAKIDGGNERTSGTDQALVLNASPSVDPDDMATPWSFAWTCLNKTDSTACVESDGITALAFSPNATNAIARVPANTITTGAYVFSVLVKKDDRNDTATTTVVVSQGAPPVVSIAILSTAKYNPIADTFVQLVGAAAASDSGTIASTAWSQVGSSVSGAFVPGSDVRTTGVVQLDTLTAGITYTFKLTATDISGESSYATVEVVVNEPPSSGSLTLSPGTGYVFETDFTFLTENWVDEDLPLTYKFVYMVGYESDGGAETPVADQQLSASYDCVLPQGLSAHNYTLTAKAYVHDTYSAYAYTSDTVRVLPVEYSTAQLANISGDPEASMQIMGATHKSLSGDSASSRRRRRLLSSSAEAAVRTSLLATLEATYAVSEITESNVESMMSTLDGIVNAPNDLTTATAVGCLVFAKKLLSASVDGSIGITTTAAGYTGTAASYLLLSSMFNASDVESATAASAANLTDALRYLSVAQLDGAYAGVAYTLSSTLIHSSSAREEAQYLGGETKGVPGSSATVAMPSNFSKAAKLGVTATTYVDTRVVTIDTDVYTSCEGCGNTIATNMYGSSKYNTDLISAVTQVSWWSKEGRGREVRLVLQLRLMCPPPGRSHGRRWQRVRCERVGPRGPNLRHNDGDRALEHFVVGDGEGLPDRRRGD